MILPQDRVGLCQQFFSAMCLEVVMARKLLAMLLCACILTGMVSCSKQDGNVEPSPGVSVDTSDDNNTTPPPTQTPHTTPEENPPAMNPSETEAANLYKLCKVWGFVKQTHLAFLTGEKDWDEELLRLIPVIQTAAEYEVNDILYDWFISLGDDGYESHGRSYKEPKFQTMADMAWIANESYLGAQLSSALLRFEEIPSSHSSETLFRYSFETGGSFRNEHQYLGMFGYGIGTAVIETGYRLLGLFRLWNAIEYYFPYKDIMDENWNEILLEFIPKMMEGADYHSYCLTMHALGAKTQDNHVIFSNQVSVMTSRYGNFAIPVVAEYAEGQIVVLSIVRGADPNTCPLRPGDVLVEIDGVGIFEIIAERVQYISVPNGEKIRDVLPYLPLCTSREPSVTVFRDGALISSTVGTVRWQYRDFYHSYPDAQTVKPHVLLEGNIGLINPGRFNYRNMHSVMSEFSNTTGLIIDLRQYPDSMFFLIADYLLNEYMQYAAINRPYRTVPGLHINDHRSYAGPGTRLGRSDNSYFYDKPVVILMNEHSQSRCEITIMALRLGPNVAVMGSNSIGADGTIATLMLPCGNTVTFTCRGVYTPDGGQTQRIGLSPDIYVEPTIEGIRDGRDELMEVAVAFLLGQ